MIEIKLKGKQDGYLFIEEYIKRYWAQESSMTPVIVSMAISYDGKDYLNLKELAYPLSWHTDDIEFLNDWWEGERFIRLLGIKSIDDVDVVGGIYNDKPYISGSLCDTCIHANVCRFEVAKGEACEDYMTNNTSL